MEKMMAQIDDQNHPKDQGRLMQQLTEKNAAQYGEQDEGKLSVPEIQHGDSWTQREEREGGRSIDRRQASLFR